MQHETKLEELTENVKEYLDIRYELIMLKGTGKAASLGSALILWVLVALICLISILFLSLAGAYYLSEYYGKACSGFLIVGGAYLVLGLIVVICRKILIVKPFRNKIIREILKEEK